MLDRLFWLGHDAFLLRSSPTIYVDPVGVQHGPEAELVLITHAHFDHCSPEDLAKVCTPETVIIAPQDCTPCIRGIGGEHKIVEPGHKLSLLGVDVEAVPAYTRRTRLHGPHNGWLGYRIRVNGEHWYHAGDTDFIVEMKQIKADIACLPVSGRTVMNPLEAAAAADCIDPGIALPMHWGTFIGTIEHAEKFRERTDVAVQIPEPWTPED